MRVLNLSKARLVALALVAMASSVQADSTSPAPVLSPGAGNFQRIEGQSGTSTVIADASYILCGVRGMDATGDNGSFWSKIYQLGDGRWYLDAAAHKKGLQVYWFCIK